MTLLEKAHHPRFHIGESLLPANLPLFEKLGVCAEVKAIGMEKWGAEFISPWHEIQQPFEFAEAWDKSMSSAYQVRRSEFDEILIRNAARKGANVIEGRRVRDVEILPNDEGAIVRAEHEDARSETWQYRFLIDAYGRDTFLGNRFKAKQRNPKHNSAALYGYFKGAQRHPGGAAEGCRTRLGRRSHRQLFLYLRPRSRCHLPAAGRRLRLHRPGLFVRRDAGDEERFHGAEAVDTCLRQPGKAASVLKQFDKMMKHGQKEFSWFIYRVTNPTLCDLFKSPSNVFRVREALLSVLAGEIHGNTSIWRSLRTLKAIYYIASVADLKRTFMAWKRRRINIRYAEEPEGIGC